MKRLIIIQFFQKFIFFKLANALSAFNLSLGLNLVQPSIKLFKEMLLVLSLQSKNLNPSLIINRSILLC